MLRTGSRKQVYSKTRILVSRSGAKSIIGRDWLNYFHYSIEPKKGGKLNTIKNMNEESEIPQERWKIAVKNIFKNFLNEKVALNNILYTQNSTKEQYQNSRRAAAYQFNYNKQSNWR